MGQQQIVMDRHRSADRKSGNRVWPGCVSWWGSSYSFLEVPFTLAGLENRASVPWGHPDWKQWFKAPFQLSHPPPALKLLACMMEFLVACGLFSSPAVFLARALWLLLRGKLSWARLRGRESACVITRGRGRGRAWVSILGGTRSDAGGWCGLA